MRFLAKIFGLPYLLIELFYIGMPVVWTGGRADRHVITKMSQMGRLPNFLGYGAKLARAWSSAIKKAQAECWASLAWTVRFKLNQLRSTDEISSSYAPANKLKAGHLFTQVVRKKFHPNLTYNLLECRIQTKQICRTIDVLHLQHSVDCLWALTVLEKLQERVTKANNKHRMWISRRP